MKIGSRFRRVPARIKIQIYGILVIGLFLLGGASWGYDSASSNLTGMATPLVQLPKSLDFEPERPVAGDAIRVRVAFETELAQRTPLNYRWKVNDQVIRESMSPEFVNPTKRGDVVEVTVFLGDNRDEARAFRKLVRVENSPPSIKRNDERMDENGQYIARFEISDQDGDAVTLKLQKGPEGMTLDPEKRELRWSPPNGAKGTFPVQVLAADSAGAKILYSYSLTLK